MAQLKDSLITGDLRVTGTIYGLISGNANTATKLATARKINGTNFDGIFSQCKSLMDLNDLKEWEKNPNFRNRQK